RLLAAEVHLHHFARGVLFLLSEVKLRFEFFGHFDDGGKRPALLAATALQRPDRAFGNEFFDFGNFKLPARHDLPQTEITFLALKFFVVLVDLAAALRAWHFQRAEIAWNRVVLVLLGLLHDLPPHGRDFLHEFLASQPASLHLLELDFPVARELR